MEVARKTSWESEDEELKENTEVEEVIFDNKEVAKEVDNIDKEVVNIDKEVVNIDKEVVNIDLFIFSQVSVGDYDETNNL